MLKILGHRIAISDRIAFDKHVIWTAILTCYFTSCRMGELLGAYTPTAYPLRWENIDFSPSDGALLFLPCTKTRGLRGEYVDVFRFPDTAYCPVENLLTLKKSLLDRGIFNNSNAVFTLFDGNALSKQEVNLILDVLLRDVYDSDKFKVTCHSFRAGIPTLLDSLGPDITPDIKEWGRWSSLSYVRYTRNARARRKTIFDQVVCLFSNAMK